MADHCSKGKEPPEYIENGGGTLLAREGRDRDVGWEQRLLGRESNLFSWLDCLEMRNKAQKHSVDAMQRWCFTSIRPDKIQHQCEANSKPALLPTMQDTIVQTIGKSSYLWACLVMGVQQRASQCSVDSRWWLSWAPCMVVQGRGIGQYDT